MWIVDMWYEGCYQFDGITVKKSDKEEGWNIVAFNGDIERVVGYSRSEEQCKEELDHIIEKIDSDRKVIYVQNIAP